MPIIKESKRSKKGEWEREGRVSKFIGSSMGFEFSTLKEMMAIFLHGGLLQCILLFQVPVSIAH
jgi:hypothetical protein